VLTTVAAFAPLMMVPGPMGQFFWVIGATVVACLAYSVVESQLVLPAHLSRGRSATGDREETAAPELPPDASPRARFVVRWRRFQGAFSGGLERFAETRYRDFLLRSIRWRYVSMASGVGALILAMGLVASNRVAFNFFDAVESDVIVATLALPEGTPVARTEQAVDHMLATLEELVAEIDTEQMPEGRSILRHHLAAIGASAADGGGPGGGAGRVQGGHRAQIVAEFLPGPERPVSTRRIRDQWRDRVGRITEAEELSYETELFGAGKAIELWLEARDDVDLGAATDEVMAKLREYPGVIDLARSDRAGKQELELTILPEAEPLGVSLADLARQVRQAFYGEEAQRIQRGRDDVRVMVRYPESERRSLGDLEEMRIRTPSGAEVPFSTVARARLTRGYAKIDRGNRLRRVEVSGGVIPEITNGNQVVADLQAGFLPELEERHPGLQITMGGSQREQTRAFTGLFTGYLLALVAIYALLAIPLRSYLQPFVIMAVIPFGVVGAIVGHLLMGYTFSFMSIIGVVALSGVVVNASLVMVVYISRRLEERMAYVEAVQSAGVARFRPIVLTSITTFAGLTPLMLEGSIHARFLIPMAISLAFGVVFATVITLLLVPCGYLVLDDLTRGLRRPRRPSRRGSRKRRPLRAA